MTDAYQQGRLAYQNNHPMSGCAYPVDSTLRAEWMRGWNEAHNAHPGSGSPGEHSGMMADSERVRNFGRPEAHET
jgi:hypothetical protein